MERVECLLHETLAELEGPLGIELRSWLGSGKRVRPALVILTGQLFTPTGAPFCNLAAAVEMLHTATLIHDDLIDGAFLRRGRETLHTSWPVGATVLAGDYLLARTAWLVAELSQPRMLMSFAETLCTMSAGEITQILGSSGSRSREEYFRSIEAKTASLCAMATKMAGMLATAEDAQIAALHRFGWEFGIAFQIVDDVLDFVGDETRLGKPAGSDLRQGLVTLPVICYLEMSGEEATISTVFAGQRDEAQLQAAIEAVRSSGAIDAALAEARAHAGQAQEALATLPDSPSRQILWSLAEYVVDRNR